MPPPLTSEVAKAEADSGPWYDELAVSAFADAYGSVNFRMPVPQIGKNRFRTFDQANGFAVSWAGIDLAYEGDTVGGTLHLRVGPSAARLAGADTAYDLQFLQQAFATWKPYGKDSMLSVDFGKFNTIYGAEAPESQLNFNYTRGLLFNLAQPFYHTGLRANIEFDPDFWMTLLAVNGWNRSVDNNTGKSFGVQFSASVPAAWGSLFDAHLGYLVGPESDDVGIYRNYCGTPGQTVDLVLGECSDTGASQSNDLPWSASSSNSKMRHFIDLVLGLNPSPAVSLLLNADVGLDQVRDGSLDIDVAGQGESDDANLPVPGFLDQMWWGVSLMGHFQLDDKWALAARGELFGDPDGRTNTDIYVSAPDLMLYSATLTGEYAPADSVLMRLDARMDAADSPVFPKYAHGYDDLQLTTTLGVVVQTN